MPNFTKRAIKESFWKLLNEQPLTQISVREIVEECGINRNSFYYHFQDIPSLIEEIVMDAANALIQQHPSITSIDEGVEAAFRFTLDNKKAILHICNSVNRNIYEQYLMRICEYVVTTYFDTVFEKDIVSKSNRDIMILFTKCELFGLSIDWINTGMQDDAIEKLKRLLLLCNGLSSEMIKRCKENSEHNET
ncbi:TetR/AcrR family transcriptional regulator [Massiliimalia timonensis]|uniref:TetR/AcrR family transcriptional regulator n=1 Tax=Massiliimalia timonensis TaxID=1987501 RepID=UPI00189F27D6|nr:TetR/AcrR family transcriptional regulator C-terminal domain-containing protein [Massiliimalia timonensis]